MTGALKKQFRVLMDEIFFFYVMIFGGSLIGVILLQILIRTDRSIDTYFPLGTLLGAVVFCVYAFLVSVTGFRQYFNVEISMGCTRKNFFFSYFAVSVLSNLVGVLLVLAIGRAEGILYTVLYPHMAMDKEINFLFYIGKFGIPVSFAIAIVGVFCSAMILRFGRKAFWVFWMIWMIGCIGGPQIQNAVADSPNSLLGMLGSMVLRGIRAVPRNVWAILVTMFCAACLLISYLIVRKQQVD